VAQSDPETSSWMYEHHTNALLPFPVFLRRAIKHVLVGGAGVAIAVGIGTVGYHFCSKLDWLDAFLNASMILSGEGPVDRAQTAGAKLFSSFYALFSGLIFVALAGTVLAPWAHRILHRLHIDEDAATSSSSDREEK
jgi:hypothetical protein